jgi:hypothetical protein
VSAANGPTPLTLCTGPTCGPLGNQALLAQLERLPPALRQRVLLSTQHCFARCQLQPPRCPAIKLGDDWVWPPLPATLRQEISQLPAPPPPPSDPFARYFNP